ncbi:hypothetical protein J1614_006547 [Plenodomus biglobosus]|nr:hypothetical protein J1614_006547 [Plenodomus biglobosus]
MSKLHSMELEINLPHRIHVQIPTSSFARQVKYYGTQYYVAEEGDLTIYMTTKIDFEVRYDNLREGNDTS